jgi:hypothetical protein
MIEFLATTFTTALKVIGLVAGLGVMVLIVAISIAHAQVGKEIDQDIAEGDL